MKLNIAIISLITVLTGSFVLANTLSLDQISNGTWNVNYSSDGDIAGFQFNVDGAAITSASGGAAGDAGFMVSSSATTALGFSLSGATIPAGEGVMVILGLDGTPMGHIHIRWRWLRKMTGWFGNHVSNVISDVQVVMKKLEDQ